MESTRIGSHTVPPDHRSNPAVNRFVVVLAASLTSVCGHAAPDSRQQLDMGYGVLSTPYIATRISSELIFGALDSSHDAGKSTGVHSLGYRYRVSGPWLATAALTQEKLDDDRLRSWLVGVQCVHVHSSGPEIYSGISVGRATLKSGSSGSLSKTTGFQVDFIGARFGGPVYGYINLGVGYLGTLYGGVGARF